MNRVPLKSLSIYLLAFTLSLILFDLRPLLLLSLLWCMQTADPIVIDCKMMEAERWIEWEKDVVLFLEAVKYQRMIMKGFELYANSNLIRSEELIHPQSYSYSLQPIADFLFQIQKECQDDGSVTSLYTLNKELKRYIKSVVFEIFSLGRISHDLQTQTENKRIEMRMHELEQLRIKYATKSLEFKALISKESEIDPKYVQIYGYLDNREAPLAEDVIKRMDEIRNAFQKAEERQMWIPERQREEEEVVVKHANECSPAMEFGRKKLFMAELDCLIMRKLKT